MSPFFGAGQDPGRIAREAGALVPDLGDSNLRRRLSVKRGRYDEMPTEVNARQPARLTPGRIAVIDRVFRRHRAVLDHFGYEVMDRLP